MKALKLISPLVALLLITVFFAGCATITVAANATTNSTLNSTAATNATTNSTLNGNLTTGSSTPSVSRSANVNSSANSTQKAVTVGAGTNATNITLIVDNSTPAVNQLVNFTATLTSNGTPLANESVTIYHLFDGVRYNDTTNATGQIILTTSWTTPGLRTYNATFTGFVVYGASTSTAVTVNVGAMQIASKITLKISNPTPASGQVFLLNGALTSNGSGISNATVNLQWSPDNTSWSSASAPTATGNGTNLPIGNYSFSGSVSAQGLYYFRSVYAGNVTYSGSVSSIQHINCTGPQATTLYISISNSTPSVNQPLLFHGQLYATATKTPLSGEPVWLQASTDQKTWELGSASAATTVNGSCDFTGAIGSAGTYYFRLYHNATDDYLASYSSIIKVTVTSSSTKLATQLSITATPASPGAGQAIIISGILQTKESIPVPVTGGDVSLYWSSASSGTYYLASSSPSVTNAHGVYAFSGSLPSGTYYFKATYSGTSKYVAASSPVITIVVS